MKIITLDLDHYRKHKYLILRHIHIGQIGNILDSIAVVQCIITILLKNRDSDYLGEKKTRGRGELCNKNTLSFDIKILCRIFFHPMLNQLNSGCFCITSQFSVLMQVADESSGSD